MNVRLLVVGAGASYAECKAAGLPDEQRLPLMKDLSRKLWKDFNPTPFLELFLDESGHHGATDPLLLFFDLEKKRPGLIEHFFESAWRRRDEIHTPYGRRWDDVMYHGLLTPLNLILTTGLLKDNPHSKLPLSQSVATSLDSDDLVLNLNYDLIFDVALKNVGKEAVYSPHDRQPGRIWAFKPHGSFHLAVDEARGRLYFGQVAFTGDAQPPDSACTFKGFVPPRITKSFSQHPVAQAIIAPLNNTQPSVVTFWGVGNPDSDLDLFALYERVCASAGRVDYINPSDEDKLRFEAKLKRSVVHYRSAEDWLS